jgi:hypothetical protein
MKISGIIKTGGYRSITCCDSVSDVLIGEKSLYDVFEDLFNQDAKAHCERGVGEDMEVNPLWVRYVILDEPPKGDFTFDLLASTVITQKIYCEYNSGCYSEWTCGYGGFDYVAGEGHNIFNELAEQEGKFICLVI